MRYLITLFVVAALWVLFPFSIEQVYFKTANHGSVPIGELSGGTIATERVKLPDGALTEKGASELCFGIQFATYRRRNGGHLKVSWTQGADVAQWNVISSQLDDNQVRYFCPKQGMKLGDEFEIAVSGVDGKSGHSPTAWLTGDTRIGKVMLNGKQLQKSFSLTFSTHKSINLHHILKVDNSAFFIGWLLTLLIGVVALFATREQPSRNPKTSS